MSNQPSTSNPTNRDEVLHPIKTGQYDMHGDPFNQYYKTLHDMDSSNFIYISESKQMAMTSSARLGSNWPMKRRHSISNPTNVEEVKQSLMTSRPQLQSDMSNQLSSYNPTNVDEQGQPFGKYNVQGDLIIIQYQGPPPVDIDEGNELSEESRTIMNEVVQGLCQDLKIKDHSIFFACSMQTATKPITESTTACLSKTIGPKGGTIEVGGCALIVPAGALDEDIHITLTASLDLDNQTKTILTPTLRCEPSSLKFKLPVTIFLQTHYILDEESLPECKIQTSEDGINWSILQTHLSFIGRTLVFTTNHFTWYEGLLNWIKGEIDIVSSIYMRSETELVWAIHYNLDLNTEKLSENDLVRHNHRFSAQKNLTLKIEEDEPPKTIKIRPPSKEINHADLTTKCNQHTPFFIEEHPNRSVYLKATVRNKDETREFLFKLPKQRSANQSTTSSNTGNNPGNTIQIVQGVVANNSALYSNRMNISGK